MPATTVFFSWQSDRPTKEGRNLIERALKIAIGNIAQDISLEEPLREIQLDKDTQGVPGSPPIFDTIIGKIDQAAVFIPDLTFSGQRPNGDPIPNPNVLIEYGYALRGLGHSRIVAVMNTAYGKPSKETMPFDLAHHRYPIQYDVPEGAPDDYRKAQREQLAKTFESAIRAVLKFGLSNQAPPAYREPLDGRARFREKGQPLGYTHHPIKRMSGHPDTPITMADGPTLWLRVMPQQPIAPLKVIDIQSHVGNLSLMPLYTGHPYVYSVRGGDGCGIYPIDDESTPAVAFLFVDGEIWFIDASTLQFDAKRIYLDEAAFAKSLEYAATFLKERLGLAGPFRWVAGMEGIAGRMLPIPGDSFGRTRGPCASDLIEREGIFSIGGDPAETLEPFFGAVFDQCGLPRPPKKSTVPASS